MLYRRAVACSPLNNTTIHMLPMAGLSYFLWQSLCLILLLLLLWYPGDILAFTSSEYRLDSEYAGLNFFDGWDFFTDRDPTAGFNDVVANVTYYNQIAAKKAGLIDAPSDSEPVYIGVDYATTIPADGAGRPSVRISTKQNWTHGLFIGDFNHIPADVCGTWPAFWTLGPDWPYTGEIDILEGVNDIPTNSVSLHTNETCLIKDNTKLQTGVHGNKNCAYYPNYNVGCGVVDPNVNSYSNFNNVGGGVYAMQWTSEYIRVWFWARDDIPEDIIAKVPNPAAWGKPIADMEGDCLIDHHFQQHKVIFDNTFCGTYAGSIWPGSSCQHSTGYKTCDTYVAENPDVFQDAFWSINYVRIYQLVDSAASLSSITPYIASLQFPTTKRESQSVPTMIPISGLCPTYNFSIVAHEGVAYEVECSFDLPGPDLGPPNSNIVKSLEDCIDGCNYWNIHHGAYTCGGVSFDSSRPFCYYKKYIDQRPKYREGFTGARLMYYGYPEVMDDPTLQSSTSYTVFTETNVVPQTYTVPTTTLISISDNTVVTVTTNISISPTHPPLNTTFINSNSIGPGMGTPTSHTSHTIQLIPSDTSWLTNSRTLAITDSTYSDASATVLVSLPSYTFLESISDGSNTHVFEKTMSVGTTTSSPEHLPNPLKMADFVYAGCMVPSTATDSFVLKNMSSNMSINSCINSCSDSYYAGIFAKYCFCGQTGSAFGDLVSYPDRACNTSCPGDPSERCGGVMYPDRTRLSRRQADMSDAIALLTVYNNTALLYADEVESTTTRTSTITETVTMYMTSVTLSAVDVELTSVAPSYTSSCIPTSSFYEITTTQTAWSYEILSTTWHDYCSHCVGHQTILSTTVTIPYCGCRTLLEYGRIFTTATIPAIPMMTTWRKCPECIENGQSGRMTVTIPCDSAIADLTRVDAVSTNRVSTSARTNDAGDNDDNHFSPCQTRGRTHKHNPHYPHTQIISGSSSTLAIAVALDAALDAAFKDDNKDDKLHILSPMMPIPIPASVSIITPDHPGSHVRLPHHHHTTTNSTSTSNPQTLTNSNLVQEGKNKTTPLIIPPVSSSIIHGEKAYTYIYTYPPSFSSSASALALPSKGGIGLPILLLLILITNLV